MLVKVEGKKLADRVKELSHSKYVLETTTAAEVQKVKDEALANLQEVEKKVDQAKKKLELTQKDFKALELEEKAIDEVRHVLPMIFNLTWMCGVSLCVYRVLCVFVSLCVCVVFVSLCVYVSVCLQGRFISVV